MDDYIDKLIEEARGLGASEDGPGQRMMFYHDDLRSVAEKAYKLGYNIGGHEVDGDLLVAEGKGRRELARELLEEARGPLASRATEIQRSDPASGSSYNILVTLIVGRLREIAEEE